jgi:predicted nucleic acid-binding protein
MKSHMGSKTECYVDTSAFIAFLDRSDSYHDLFRRLFSDPPRFLTSALVMAEGHGWFLRRYDQNRASQFLNFIDELSILSIRSFDGDELKAAERLVKKFNNQSLTLAYAHGLAIISGRRIATCWSTDRHLGLTGAELIIKKI